jgi:hypothetical protein
MKMHVTIVLCGRMMCFLKHKYRYAKYAKRMGNNLIILFAPWIETLLDYGFITPFKFNIKYVYMRLFMHKKSHGKFVLNPIVEVVCYFVPKNENQHIHVIELVHYFVVNKENQQPIINIVCKDMLYICK